MGQKYEITSHKPTKTNTTPQPATQQIKTFSTQKTNRKGRAPYHVAQGSGGWFLRLKLILASSMSNLDSRLQKKGQHFSNHHLWIVSRVVCYLLFQVFDTSWFLVFARLVVACALFDNRPQDCSIFWATSNHSNCVLGSYANTKHKSKTDFHKPAELNMHRMLDGRSDQKRHYQQVDALSLKTLEVLKWSAEWASSRNISCRNVLVERSNFFAGNNPN